MQNILNDEVKLYEEEVRMMGGVKRVRFFKIMLSQLFNSQMFIDKVQDHARKICYLDKTEMKSLWKFIGNDSVGIYIIFLDENDLPFTFRDTDKNIGEICKTFNKLNKDKHFYIEMYGTEIEKYQYGDKCFLRIRKQTDLPWNSKIFLRDVSSIFRSLGNGILNLWYNIFSTGQKQLQQQIFENKFLNMHLSERNLDQFYLTQQKIALIYRDNEDLVIQQLRNAKKERITDILTVTQIPNANQESRMFNLVYQCRIWLIVCIEIDHNHIIINSNLSQSFFVTLKQLILDPYSKLYKRFSKKGQNLFQHVNELYIRFEFLAQYQSKLMYETLIILTGICKDYLQSHQIENANISVIDGQQSQITWVNHDH